MGFISQSVLAAGGEWARYGYNYGASIDYLVSVVSGSVLHFYLVE